MAVAIVAFTRMERLFMSELTQDEIIEIAKQAGWKDMKDYDSEMNESFFIGKFTDLEAFAKLVASAAIANEQEAIIDLVAFYGGPVDLEAAIRARVIAKETA
jgi:hypothetical protein